MPTIQKAGVNPHPKKRLQKPTQFSMNFIINLTLQSFFSEETNKTTIQTTARQEKRWAFFASWRRSEKTKRIPAAALRCRVLDRAFASVFPTERLQENFTIEHFEEKIALGQSPNG